MSNQGKYVFFWGHKSGTNACFSNWCPAKFKTDDGILFQNSEQYMMWGKAKLFGDETMAQKILETPDPRQVKGLGRKVRNFDGKLWNKEAKNIVRDGCLLKFRQNKTMNETLLSTGNKMLVEASPHDSIWGIGLDAAAARKVKEEDWPGTNWLGQVLMEVREILRKEENNNNNNDEDDDNTEEM
mmetsp:Transcript_2290/g.3797  ORF Transcript_2290/g.3797 Transcript_2290/m.3797 type:complete len:184 (+) Transcript_2290:32-583(+)